MEARLRANVGQFDRTFTGGRWRPFAALVTANEFCFTTIHAPSHKVSPWQMDICVYVLRGLYRSHFYYMSIWNISLHVVSTFRANVLYETSSVIGKYYRTCSKYVGSDILTCDRMVWNKGEVIIFHEISAWMNSLILHMLGVYCFVEITNILSGGMPHINQLCAENNVWNISFESKFWQGMLSPKNGPV